MNRGFMICIGLSLCVGAHLSVFAKRAAPEPLVPLEYQGVRYQPAERVREADGQMGGVLQATNISSNTLLWTQRIYRNSYNLKLERDVQDVFITSITLTDKCHCLVIGNEQAQYYRLDLRS